MSNSHYITNLCHDLHAQGKTPSVALIRHLSSRPLPMPEVIKALQGWKTNPAQKRIEDVPTMACPPLSLEARIEKLEKQLTLVMSELAELKSNM